MEDSEDLVVFLDLKDFKMHLNKEVKVKVVLIHLETYLRNLKNSLGVKQGAVNEVLLNSKLKVKIFRYIISFSLSL